MAMKTLLILILTVSSFTLIHGQAFTATLSGLSNPGTGTFGLYLDVPYYAGGMLANPNAPEPSSWLLGLCAGGIAMVLRGRLRPGPVCA